MSETTTRANEKTASADEFRHEVRQLKRHVGRLHDDLAGIAEGAGKAAESGVAAVKEGGRERLAAAKDRSEEVAGTLRGRVVDHLGASLGIALGVGVLIGIVGPAILRSKGRSS